MHDLWLFVNSARNVFNRRQILAAIKPKVALPHLSHLRSLTSPKVKEKARPETVDKSYSVSLARLRYSCQSAVSKSCRSLMYKLVSLLKMHAYSLSPKVVLFQVRSTLSNLSRFTRFCTMTEFSLV